jgi:hypothetical protein
VTSIPRCPALLASTIIAGLLIAGAARAEDPASTPALSDPLESLLGPIQLSGHIETGVTLNPANPSNGINFGRLFTDKADQLVLNQFALTVERDIDPKANRFELGFKIQGTYGMDSQFIHSLGIGDQATTGRNSFDPVEISLEAHAPVLTRRGIDVKAGIFPTPMGYESIDPTQNFFYSKSYIFNFGLPFKHAGVLTTTHVNSILDVYLGYTTGVNTSFGAGGGYNDGRPHVLGGFGLNFPTLTILALTHIGPEDPLGSLPANVPIHDQKRYLNDVVATWKVTDKLTSVTEFNYVRDDGLKADGGGVAEYLTYTLSPKVAAGFRAEVWRDAEGKFVLGYPGNLDFINAEEGLPNHAYGPGPETYGEVTAGLNIKPGGLPAMIDGLTIRPELRYDRDLAGAPPGGGGGGGGRAPPRRAAPAAAGRAAAHRQGPGDDRGRCRGATLLRQERQDAVAGGRAAFHRRSRRRNLRQPEDRPAGPPRAHAGRRLRAGRLRHPRHPWRQPARPGLGSLRRRQPRGRRGDDRQPRHPDRRLFRSGVGSHGRRPERYRGRGRGARPGHRQPHQADARLGARPRLRPGAGLSRQCGEGAVQHARRRHGGPEDLGVA